MADPRNTDKPPVEIERFEGPMDCPTCTQGSLVGRRDSTTFEMLKQDSCLLCGQMVVYKSLGPYENVEDEDG